MALGLSIANLANRLLDTLGGTSFSVANVYVKLHTGDPGASGTANASAETTRKLITWSAAASAVKAMTGTLSWAAWTAGTETITHISLWDASTAGNFLWSGALTAPKTVGNSDTLTLTSLIVAVIPIAGS